MRGRCRDCKEPISARYPLVEFGTAALFAGLAARLGVDGALPAFLYLAAASVALALIDLDTRRLPDRIVLPSYVVGLVLLGAPALVRGDGGAYLRALAGMGALYAVYFVLAFAYPAGMGFGDVKTAGVLGLHLGWLGWGPWLVGWIGGFLAGGLAGVTLLASGRASRKTAIPYGPFLIAGAFLGVFAGGPLARLWLGDTLG